MMFSIKLPSLDFLSGGKPLNLFAPNEINFCQKRQIDGKKSQILEIKFKSQPGWGFELG